MKRIAFKNLFPITCKHALILKIPYNIFLWENYEAELFWPIDNGNNTPKETTIPILGPYVKIIFALNNCNACFFLYVILVGRIRSKLLILMKTDTHQ